jgi:5,10-methylene-tetrahydrofolate dehydrogenase/methenyl tetrahydrofolate cyclohydrolase
MTVATLMENTLEVAEARTAAERMA